jgi:ribosome biogenesis GTPase
MPKPIRRGKPVRKRTWDANDWDTASREGRSKRADSAPESPRPSEDYFSSCDANGIVVSPYGVLAFALCGETECLCRVDDALVDGKSSILAPGDHVFVESDERGPVVRAVRPRRNKLSRPAIERDREQVFAANIDRAVIVASVARPAFNPGLIDRYLVAAQAGGVEPIICINKSDLCEAELEGAAIYRDLGLAVVTTSCTLGEGLPNLRELLAGKTSVLVGHSGVGKSSLVNALDPNLTVYTQEISDSTNKGRHTTSASRLYELTGGIRIIDTPGVKQLGLWGVSPAELNYYFHEIAAISGQCRFRDCTHTHEPKCAVRDAVDAGEIARPRFDSYLRIRASLHESAKSTER